MQYKDFILYIQDFSKSIPYYYIILYFIRQFHKLNLDFRAGFRYGLRFFDEERYESFHLEFPEDIKFARNLNPTDIYRKHGFKRKLKRNNFEKTFSKFPRKNKANPWHMIDLQDFILKFTTNPYILRNDPHFSSYVSYKPLSPCENFYNIIVKQEFLSQELGFLATHLKLNLTNTNLANTYHSNSAKLDLEYFQKTANFYLDQIKIETRKLLFEHFAVDLTIFGYGWNFENNKIIF